MTPLVEGKDYQKFYQGFRKRNRIRATQLCESDLLAMMCSINTL